MIVKIEELEAVASAVFATLRADGIHSVEIDDGYYWNIPRGSLQDFRGMPTDLDIGDLASDWDDLQTHAQERCFLGGAPLRWLSAVLRSAGDSLEISRR
jgi:hypothetical protein